MKRVIGDRHMHIPDKAFSFLRPINSTTTKSDPATQAVHGVVFTYLLVWLDVHSL